ncbi:MAG TPA: LirA/MavJ family T4SS effector [Acetobacteraceae bacterium]|nr:LirA/MavJ family T4SS effector [Acetobacteraceae bacterium]
MSGSRNQRPWEYGSPLDLRRFTAAAHREAYAAIHDLFLRLQSRVQTGLAELSRATDGMGRRAFQDYLAAEERRFNLGPPATITKADGLIKGSRFWMLLYKRHPIIDLGAGDEDHGVLIHRVQWVLIGQWNERSNFRLGPATIIGDLYGHLGTAGARVLSENAVKLLEKGGKVDTGKGAGGGQPMYNSIWDEVVDRTDVENATKPEFLRAYIESRYSALYSRMLW